MANISKSMLLNVGYLPGWTAPTWEPWSIRRWRWARKRELASFAKSSSIPWELFFFYCAEFYKCEKCIRSIQYQESIRKKVYGSQPRTLILFLIRRTELVCGHQLNWGIYSLEGLFIQIRKWDPSTREMWLSN